MVVEDEPDIYDVLLAMFEIWGIEGVAFVDGGEAVAWIDEVDAGRVRGDLPELAILDIRVPEVKGPQIAARLRRSPVLGDIAIVLITAHRLSPEEEAEAMAISGADLLQYKPLPGMVELRRMMDTVIAKRKRIKAARETAESGTVQVTETVSAPPNLAVDAAVPSASVPASTTSPSPKVDSAQPSNGKSVNGNGATPAAPEH